MALAVQKRLTIMQFDVKTAFLHGNLEEEVYMTKQSLRCWNKKFTSFLKSCDFKQSDADNCVYIGIINESEVIIALYVDDGLIFTNNFTKIKYFVDDLNKNFEITLTKANNFVGIEINQSADDKNSIIINANSYINKILKLFKFI